MTLFQHITYSPQVDLSVLPKLRIQVQRDLPLEKFVDSNPLLRKHFYIPQITVPLSDRFSTEPQFSDNFKSTLHIELCNLQSNCVRKVVATSADILPASYVNALLSTATEVPLQRSQSYPTDIVGEGNKVCSFSKSISIMSPDTSAVNNFKVGTLQESDNSGTPAEMKCNLMPKIRRKRRFEQYLLSRRIRSDEPERCADGKSITNLPEAGVTKHAENENQSLEPPKVLVTDDDLDIDVTAHQQPSCVFRGDPRLYKDFFNDDDKITADAQESVLDKEKVTASTSVIVSSVELHKSCARMYSADDSVRCQKQTKKSKDKSANSVNLPTRSETWKMLDYAYSHCRPACYSTPAENRVQNGKADTEMSAGPTRVVAKTLPLGTAKGERVYFHGRPMAWREGCFRMIPLDAKSQLCDPRKTTVKNLYSVDLKLLNSKRFVNTSFISKPASDNLNAQSAQPKNSSFVHNRECDEKVSSGNFKCSSKKDLELVLMPDAYLCDKQLSADDSELSISGHHSGVKQAEESCDSRHLLSLGNAVGPNFNGMPEAASEMSCSLQAATVNETCHPEMLHRGPRTPPGEPVSDGAEYISEAKTETCRLIDRTCTELVGVLKHQSDSQAVFDKGIGDSLQDKEGQCRSPHSSSKNIVSSDERLSGKTDEACCPTMNSLSSALNSSATGKVYNSCRVNDQPFTGFRTPPSEPVSQHNISDGADETKGASLTISDSLTNILKQILTKLGAPMNIDDTPVTISCGEIEGCDIDVAVPAEKVASQADTQMPVNLTDVNSETDSLMQSCDQISDSGNDLGSSSNNINDCLRRTKVNIQELDGVSQTVCDADNSAADLTVIEQCISNFEHDYSHNIEGIEATPHCKMETVKFASESSSASEQPVLDTTGELSLVIAVESPYSKDSNTKAPVPYDSRAKAPNELNNPIETITCQHSAGALLSSSPFESGSLYNHSLTQIVALSGAHISVKTDDAMCVTDEPTAEQASVPRQLQECSPGIAASFNGTSEQVAGSAAQHCDRLVPVHEVSLCNDCNNNNTFVVTGRAKDNLETERDVLSDLIESSNNCAESELQKGAEEKPSGSSYRNCFVGNTQPSSMPAPNNATLFQKNSLKDCELRATLNAVPVPPTDDVCMTAHKTHTWQSRNTDERGEFIVQGCDTLEVGKYATHMQNDDTETVTALEHVPENWEQEDGELLDSPDKVDMLKRGSKYCDSNDGDSSDDRCSKTSFVFKDPLPLYHTSELLADDMEVMHRIDVKISSGQRRPSSFEWNDWCEAELQKVDDGGMKSGVTSTVVKESSAAKTGDVKPSPTKEQSEVRTSIKNSVFENALKFTEGIDDQLNALWWKMQDKRNKIQMAPQYSCSSMDRDILSFQTALLHIRSQLSASARQSNLHTTEETKLLTNQKRTIMSSILANKQQECGSKKLERKCETSQTVIDLTSDELELSKKYGQQERLQSWGLYKDKLATSCDVSARKRCHGDVERDEHESRSSKHSRSRKKKRKRSSD